MPRVEEWFPKFMVEHVSRVRRDDWPQLGTDDGDTYWHAFEKNLLFHGTTFELATDASILMAGDPPQWLSEQSKVLLETVKRLRDERSEHGVVGVTDDRDSALRASISCLDCGPAKPSGFATRWRHDDLPLPGLAPTVRFFCQCPMGRWTQMRHAMQAKDGKLPFPDMKCYPALWRGEVPWSQLPDNKYCYPPGDWNALDGRPIADVDAPADPAYLREFCRRIAAASRVPARRPAESSRSSALAALAVTDPVVARELAPRPSPPAPAGPTFEPDSLGWF